jgi:5-methylcytosine-specific restriction endonuclease McrA
MPSRRRAELILAIIATDATWERREVRGERLWVGRCIFCNRSLTVAEDGSVTSRATVEHIVPRSHGGDDSLENLALACVGCNNEKGMRHDARRRGDPKLADIIAALQQKRRERWRPHPTKSLEYKA